MPVVRSIDALCIIITEDELAAWRDLLIVAMHQTEPDTPERVLAVDLYSRIPD